ncbi:unnamed protein product [Merluccius merluccius]
MKLSELIGNSNTGQQCLAENGRAPNFNMPSFQSEPVSYNSHLINGDRSSSGSSCYIWADADLQSKENIEGETVTLESEENKRCSRTQNIRSPARSSERAGEAQDQAESCASETGHPSSSHTSLEDMVSSSSETDGFRESYTWSLESNGDGTSTFMSHEDERVDADGSGSRSFGRKSVAGGGGGGGGCRAICYTIRYRRTTGLPTQTGHTGVGGVEGDGYDAQADVEPGRNLVAVLRNAPEGNSSPILSLEVRPRTPQEHDHTCQEDSLTSVLRMRGCCLANGANQAATADEDPGFLSHASNDGRHPTVSCCLQRVLDDTKHSAASLGCSVLKDKGSGKNRDALVSLNLSRDGGSIKFRCIQAMPSDSVYT